MKRSDRCSRNVSAAMAFVGAGAVLLLALATLRAPGPSIRRKIEAPPSTNAADQYRLAVRQCPRWTPDQSRMIAEPHTAALDARSRGLLRRAHAALGSFRHAATMTADDWDPHLLADPDQLLEELTQLRTLALLTVLHSRAELAEGRAESATEDMIVIFRASSFHPAPLASTSAI